MLTPLRARLANIQNGNYYGAYVDAGLYWNATNRTRFMWMGASPAVTGYGLCSSPNPPKRWAVSMTQRMMGKGR